MTDVNPLRPGDAVPHFEVSTLEGSVVSYAAIWQHRNLVLVTLPPAGPDSSYVSELTARGPEFHERKSACVITRDRVAGLPPPGVLVADRWGKIVHAATESQVADLPPPEELLEWLEYLEHRCPECEGEAR